MIACLESECTKLGIELEREKGENFRAKEEIEKLRKNISFLSEKLEKAF